MEIIHLEKREQNVYNNNRYVSISYSVIIIVYYYFSILG